MHIRQIFDRHPVTFSLEFFPPKTQQATQELLDALPEFEALGPAFVDVTYGAGGGTREATFTLVNKLATETKMDPIPHLTCVCHDQATINQILESYAQAGISNILALGGDLPRDRQDWDRSKDAFRYAGDLVAHIRKFNDKGVHPDRQGFGIGVAGFPEGHPATPNRLAEMDYLKAKVDAGADYIVTQLFFDNHDFHDFRERCELAGIHVPIFAGLLPINATVSLNRMADLAAGARFPAKLLRKLQACQGNAQAIEQTGIDWAIEQSRDLLAHKVAGIHYYTLNKPAAVTQIFQALGLPGSR